MNTWKAGTATVTERRFVGAASPGTLQAGTTLIAYFTTHACTHDSLPEVEDFQNAWNGDNPTNKLVVDGEYGPLTQGALETAMGTTNVPANCFGGPAQPPVPIPPAVPPVIVVTPPGTPTTTTTGGSNNLPWILGGLVLVAGSFAAYTYSKKSKTRKH